MYTVLAYILALLIIGLPTAAMAASNRKRQVPAGLLLCLTVATHTLAWVLWLRYVIQEGLNLPLAVIAAAGMELSVLALSAFFADDL